jgi:hypothetical protein
MSNVEKIGCPIVHWCFSSSVITVFPLSASRLQNDVKVNLKFAIVSDGPVPLSLIGNRMRMRRSGREFCDAFGRGSTCAPSTWHQLDTSFFFNWEPLMGLCSVFQCSPHRYFISLHRIAVHVVNEGLELGRMKCWMFKTVSYILMKTQKCKFFSLKASCISLSLSLSLSLQRRSCSSLIVEHCSCSVLSAFPRSTNFKRAKSYHFKPRSYHGSLESLSSLCP